MIERFLDFAKGLATIAIWLAFPFILVGAASYVFAAALKLLAWLIA